MTFMIKCNINKYRVLMKQVAPRRSEKRVISLTRPTIRNHILQPSQQHAKYNQTGKIQLKPLILIHYQSSFRTTWIPAGHRILKQFAQVGNSRRSMNQITRSWYVFVDICRHASNRSLGMSQAWTHSSKQHYNILVSA